MITFEDLLINKNIRRAIYEIGYETPTEIQKKAIPVILEGKDVLGLSNTGTGKTAAFGLPLLSIIKTHKKYPSALIICPTRELVEQVASELRKFSKYIEGVKIVPIYGGQSIDRQIQQLKKGATIVIGTPGRLMDHLRRKTLKLQDCKKVVLDEADEMLNMGFKEDIESILQSISKDDLQTILFSATMPKEILRITKEFQNHPVKIQIKSAQKTIDTIEQSYYMVPKEQKQEALNLLLMYMQAKSVIIFCNTKRMVDEISEQLQQEGLKAAGLHGDMKQMMRDRVMQQFRDGKISILIATDVAARGIDVDHVELVVNIDVPQNHEYYIHRIGRTGRAGRKGKAITIISGKQQQRLMKDLSRYTKASIQEATLPTNEQYYQQQEDIFLNQVKLQLNKCRKEEYHSIISKLKKLEMSEEELLYSLVSSLYQPKSITIKQTRKKEKSNIVCDEKIKISLGRKHRIQPAHIVAGISEYCDIDSNVIGKIDILARETIVSLSKKHAKIVVSKLQGVKIKGEKAYSEYIENLKKSNRKKKDKKKSKKK